jgi:diguanylate cyclase (GGDEF)-like protein
MIDIDFFKKINDKYGHPAGDEALRVLAERVKKRLRKGDIFGRYGGEEFCVSTLDVTPENALLLAEEIRTIICAEPIVYESDIIHMSISIGIGLYMPGQRKTANELLTESDRALYAAKKAGRNCCRLYDKATSI